MKGSYRPLFLLVLIGLHVLGFIKQTVETNAFTLDSDDYINLAENLKDYQLPYSGTITEYANLEDLPNKGLFASRPILYSVFIWLTGGLSISILLTLLIQNLLSIFSILCIEKLIRAHGFKIHYEIATIGLLLFPTLWIYANWIMAETLFMFCLSLCIYFFAKPKPAYLLSTLFLCLALYTKPAVVFILFLWLIGFTWHYFKTRKPKIIAVAILPMLLLGVQIIANFTYTQAPIISSMPGINLVQYNAYFTLCKTKNAHEASEWVSKIDLEGAELEKEIGFKTAYNYKKNQATQIIKSNLSTYLSIHTQGSLRWFIDPGRFDLLNFFTIYNEDGNQGWTRTYYQKGLSGLWERAKQENIILLALILLILIWNLTRIILLTKNLPILLRKKPLALLFLFLLVYFAGISGPVSTARFLMPVFPVILFWSSLKKK